jgi:hypothetical protein
MKIFHYRIDVDHVIMLYQTNTGKFEGGVIRMPYRGYGKEVLEISVHGTLESAIKFAKQNFQSAIDN